MAWQDCMERLRLHAPQNPATHYAPCLPIHGPPIPVTLRHHITPSVPPLTLRNPARRRGCFLHNGKNSEWRPASASTCSSCVICILPHLILPLSYLFYIFRSSYLFRRRVCCALVPGTSVFDLPTLINSRLFLFFLCLIV